MRCRRRNRFIWLDAVCLERAGGVAGGRLAASVACLVLLTGFLVHRTCGASDFLVLPDGTGTYPTIEAAVTASAPGDTITLGDGVFTGPGNRDINVFWRLLIRSQSGDPTQTELLGEPSADGILLWDNTGGSVLAGVTFTGFDLGVYLGDYEGAQAVHHCHFQQCRIGLGIEAFYSAIEDCLFSNNHDGNDGTAVLALATATSTRCIFRDNETESSGGAVKTWTANLTFRSCLFVNNHAANQGGAVWNEDGGSLQFVNCTFYGNICPDGSALHSGYHTQTTFHNCIVAFGQGYPVSCRYSSPDFYCSDVYGNVGGDWVGCGLGPQLGTNGNISLDPLFCNPANGDFRLQHESPCAPFSPYSPECDLMGALPVGCQSSGVPEQERPLRAAGLLHVRPNPSFGPVNILFPSIATAAGTPVRVEIHDAAGRSVRTLWGGGSVRAEGPGFVDAPAGLGAAGTIAFDGCNERGESLPTGVYLVRMSAGEQTLGSRFVLIR